MESALDTLHAITVSGGLPAMVSHPILSCAFAPALIYKIFHMKQEFFCIGSKEENKKL